MSPTMGLLKQDLFTNDNKFWNAIKIYCTHPNSINKEIICSEAVYAVKLEWKPDEADCLLIFNEFYNYIFLQRKNVIDAINVIEVLGNFKIVDISEVFSHLNDSYLIIRKILPKRTFYSDNDFYELCFIDVEKKIVRLYQLFDRKLENFNEESCNVNAKYDPHVVVKFNRMKIIYSNNCLALEHDELSEKGRNWIKSVFMSKLSKLILCKNQESKNNLGITFLSQINLLDYYKLYETLKLKYAKFFIENWTESTNPQKFVFEDIGIATYLLLLWNKGKLPSDTSARQNFVDLGCGNGLLVYILSCEGHKGVGLDVRKRKIWDTYPSTVVLKEKTVVPGSESVYPNVDWLIGNHSDELTPWIPIMARRSNCGYFLLPCCPFHLNGETYQRKNSSLSTYNDFIRYVGTISDVCGFETVVDKLRIPSTKRICLIGRKKELPADELRSVNDKIDLFIGRESRIDATDSDDLSDTNWISRIKVRRPVESVRNCTALPKDFIENVVLRIARQLLAEENVLETRNGVESRKWNRGGQLPLGELAALLSPEELKMLKNECKGLQTLLRNHHYVFNVCGGFVRLRNAEEMSRMSQKIFRETRKSNWKRKECWFDANHPNGCPLSENACSYRHG